MRTTAIFAVMVMVFLCLRPRGSVGGLDVFYGLELAGF
jgi:hypothetical protein